MKLCAVAGNCFAQLRLMCFLIAVFYFLPASANNCDSSHFQCTEDDSCVFSEFKCDGRNDCPNGSDEKDCPPKPCIVGEEFDCGNGTQCIPLYWACNGNRECQNGHDEDQLICENLTCPANMYFKCGSMSHCVPASWKCDGHNDCPVLGGETHSSDEQKCADQECAKDVQFKCLTGGTCIDKTWKCDGQMDCPDNSDEAGCPKTTCQHNEFVCVTSGKCIPDRWKCDGDKDCDDESDEWLNSTCKDKKPDASMCRLTSEFFCAADKQCIPRKWMCDGQQDCTDGSDEHDSHCDTMNKCRPDQFQCKQMHYCISATLKCDGVEQCLDGSDEDGCPSNHTSVPRCTEREFDCGSGQCVPLSTLCDDTPDCLNGADEGTTQLTDKVADCKASRPCDTNNGGCQHECLNTFNTDPKYPKGYKCLCPTGFKVSPSDPSRCLDVNECDEWGVCSQQCLNTKGSYSCRCLHGYALRSEDQRTCSALTGEAHLLVSHRHDIRTVGTRNSHNQEAVVKELRDAVAIDYSAQEKLIFWSDLVEEKIYSAHEVTGKKTELATDTKVVDGIAFDWIHKLLYFTEAIENHISALTIGGDTTKRCRIITSDLDEPRAIVLDPKNGLLFWTDWGAESKIERADLDGSNRKSLVDSTEVVWPNGLTIDTVLLRLYWVDGKSGKIGSMRYDGSGKKVILSSLFLLPHPFSIAVFEDLLYISDWDRQAIFSLNKFTGVEEAMIYSNASKVMAVRVRHDLLQPESENYCHAHKCEYMCLPRALATHTGGYKYRCACPPDQFLGADGASCSATAPTTQYHSSTTSPTTSARFSKTTSAKSGTTAKAGSTKSPEASTKQHTNKPTPSSGTKSGKLTTPTESSSTSPAHHVQSEAVSRSSGKVAGIVIGALCALAVIAALVGFLVYRGYVRRNAKTIGFDNPVYRKTTAAEDTISLDHAFQPKAHKHSSSAKLPLTEDTDDTA